MQLCPGSDTRVAAMAAEVQRGGKQLLTPHGQTCPGAMLSALPRSQPPCRKAHRLAAQGQSCPDCCPASCLPGCGHCQAAAEGPGRSRLTGSSCAADGSLTAEHTIHIYRVSSVTGMPKPRAENNSKDIIKSVKWLGKRDMATARFQLSAQSQGTGNNN